MSERIKVWDLPVRVFHWGLVASFVGAYLSAEWESNLELHVVLGYTATGLILFRVLWGFIGTRYARFSSFLDSPAAALRYLRGLLRRAGSEHVGHNPAGSWVIYAILLLGLATGVTGYLTYEGIGGEAAEELHEVLANAWLAVVFVHVAGVIVSSLVHRQNLVRAMITGYKEGSAASASPSMAPLVGAGVAAAVLAFWSWALVSGSFAGPAPAEAREAGESEHRLASMDDHEEDDED
jgi:cytochrome b